ncbi:MAG: DNA photolyase family protein, partial [Myxococcales bacterium]|nr:DNA photolyase family protein [Myxococcales bacterium]
WKEFERRAARAQTRLRLPPPVATARRRRLPTESDLGVAGDPTELPKAGEAAALQRLRSFLDRHVEAYEKARDFPALDATSRLSPYLRFGALSIRRCIQEAQKAAERDSSKRAGTAKWLDELVWREFYHAILDVHPRVLRGSFRREYDSLEWVNDEAEFAAWCAGRTGYPFVDAAMRQLLATGFMHNRARMVTASFLTKDLLVDWRWGERFFMSRLLDGDPASNNGGWQWAASTGTDAQPYFRIFNPVAQGERFDPEGEYVRRWVPELAGFSGKSAHRPWEQPLLAPDYPAPIVDHAERRKLALERFKAARETRVAP